MLRALSTRSRRGYERLGDESAMGLLEGKLKRATSVPVRLFSPSKKLGSSVSVIKLGVINEENLSRPKPAKKAASASKFSHPIFSFFDGRRRKKKSTAKPEFARYLEYLKEGGIWDAGSNKPAIYYK